MDKKTLFAPPTKEELDLFAPPTEEELKSSEGSALETLDDARRGANQGALLGFADEAGAAIQTALDKLLGGITDVDRKLMEDTRFGQIKGDLTATSGDLYRKALKEEREADKLAQERSPTAYTVGNIGGGLVTGLATGAPLSPFSAAKFAGKLGNAALAGGLSGGAIGLGMSEADLLGGEYGEALADTTEGAVGGALAGAGLQTVLSAAGGARNLAGKALTGTKEFLEDNPFISKVLDARNLEKAGKKLTGNSGFQAAKDELVDVATKLGVGAKETFEQFPAQIEKAIKDFDDSGVKLSLKEPLTKLRNKLTERLKNETTDTDKIRQDVQKAIDVIDDYLYGRAEKITKKVVVGKTKSGRQLAEEELVDLAEDSSLKGENARYEVIPSPKTGQLKIQKFVDEPVGTGEKLQTVKGPAKTEVTETVKYKWSSEENSPKDLAEAKKRLSKLQEKNPNNKYELVDNKDKGKYEIFETKPTVKKIPGEESQVLVRSEEGPYKSSNPIVKKIKDTPSEDIVEEVEELVRMGTPEKTAREIVKLRRNASDLTNYRSNMAVLPEMQTDEGTRIGRDIVKAIKEVEENIPGLPQLNLKSSKTASALEKLGLEEGKDFIFDKVSGEMSIKSVDLGKIVKKITDLESESTAGIPAEAYFKEVFDSLRESNPKLVQELEPMIREAAKRFDVSREIRRNTFAQNPILGPIKSFGIQGGALTGRAERFVSEKINNWTPDLVKRLATKAAQGNPKLKKLALDLSDVLKKDGVGRNAAMFSLLQRPEARQMIDELMGSNEE